MTAGLEASAARKTPILVRQDTGEPIYALQPRQLVAFNHTPLVPSTPSFGHIGYGGAAGGGKSYLARAVVTAAALLWPGSTGIVFRRTFREVDENHAVPFQREVPSDEGRLYRYNATDRVVTWANGSRTLFAQLKAMEDVEKYQGNAYDVMIFEEATHYDWSWVSWLVGNRLRSSVAGSRPFALYPSNPGGRGHHWFVRLFVNREYEANEDPEEFVFVPAKLEDNPELTERDPVYAKRLDSLAEPYRSWLRDGDFTAGAGLALPSLTAARHLVRPFEVPEHWVRFGSFDWGYQHPFAFGSWAVNEDGRLFLLDTVIGRHLIPALIAERVLSRLPQRHRLSYVAGAHDAFDDKGRHLGANIRTIAETMLDEGLPMVKANRERKQGLQLMREYFALDPQAGVPWCVLFETPDNERVLKQLQQTPLDPDDPEDALKTDADEFGHGGDDFYDMARYGIASRPPVPRSKVGGAIEAWSPEVLRAEYERGHRTREPSGAGGLATLRQRAQVGEFGAQW